MHIEKIIPQNKYGKYFLATEAPGDDEESSPRRNMKTIDIKPNKRARLDFSADAIPKDEPEEPQTDDTSNTDVQATDGGDDNPDFTTDTDQNTDTDSLSDDDGENVDFTTGLTDSDGNDESGDGDADAGDDQATDGGDEDNPDFTSGMDDGSGEDSSTGDGGADTASTDGSGDESQPKGPGLEYASTRKYILFMKFMDLYSSSQYYLDKMDDLLKDDNFDTYVVKDAKAHMQEEKELLYEYMTTHFPGSTYVQNLLFYNKMLATIQLIFNQLEISKKANVSK